MSPKPKDLAQAQRLRAARLGRGFQTAAAAIARFGWKQSTYLAHENGQNGIKADAALDYGKAFKVDPAWLLTGLGKGLTEEGREFTGSGQGKALAMPPREIIEVAGTELVRIPIYDIRAAAGFGAENYDETPIDHFMIALQMLRAITDAPPEMIGILQIMGDSMYSTLKDRDLAWVDLRRKKFAREGIYAMNFEGETIVKRVQQNLETGAVTLISDNPIYKPQTIKHPERLHVQGQIFWSLSRH